MGVIVLLGALAYFGLTLASTAALPANPDTHFDAENGSRWITKVPSGPSAR